MNRDIVMRNEKGQSLTELALVFLMLMLILAGIVDLGRILFHYISMRDAAQEAVTYGAVYPAWCAQIRNRAQSAMGDTSVFVIIQINDLSGTVDNCESAVTSNWTCSGNDIKVTVSDPAYELTMPLIGAFLGTQAVSLSADITGTILRPKCP